MKRLFVGAAILFSTIAFGNDTAGILAKYEATVRVGNIITRLYYDIVATSLVFKKKLILFRNYTYSYTYEGGECTTFDTSETGTWRMSKDTLWLNKYQINSSRFYIIKENKLYEPGTEITRNDYSLKLNN